MICQKEEYLKFIDNKEASILKVPNQAVAAARGRAVQMKCAKQCGKLLLNRSVLQEEIDEEEIPSRRFQARNPDKSHQRNCCIQCMVKAKNNKNAFL